MAQLPSHKNEFLPECEAFKTWLVAHGSSILAPTSPFELLRFQGKNCVAIIYIKITGKISSWIGGADTAWWAFKGQGEWYVGSPIKRAKKSAQLIYSLAQRDGWGCVYCGQELDVQTSTLEHIVPILHGGSNSLVNLTLACTDCNREMGHLSPREKIDLAIRRRS